MRRLASLLFAVLGIAALSAPASAAVVFIPIIIPIPAQVPRGQTGGYSRIHNVAVVSAIGTRFTVQNNTFWGVKKYPLDIAGWHVDDTVESTLRQYLSSRFHVVGGASVNRAEIGSLPNGPFDNTTGAVRKVLSAVPNDQLDAFVLVRPDLEYQAPGISGLALQNGTDFINDAAPVIWANYEIDIIDAHTYGVIAKAYSRVALHRGQPDSFAGLLGGPTLKTDKLILGPQQEMLVHALTSKLLTSSLIETLRSLLLGIALPEAGARTLVPIPADKQPYPDIKTVAIVSNVGGSLDYERFATILGRSSKFVPVPDWQLDALVEKEARGALASRFEIRNVPMDRAAFARASLIDSNDKLNPQFPGLSPTSMVDAYLVFVKLREPLDEITMSGTGLGMSHNAVLPKTSLFAHYAVALVDAHTLRVISATPSIASPNLPSSKPSFDVDDSLWPADPAAPTASQAADIQKYLHTLVAETCRESMLRLGLTGMMPDGAPPPAPAASSSN